ncbi:hypothetical protein NPIL_188691 [Nephila pilipes]|uniref:Uncharacterized protein n=1 Tax=Nephila pilipes TaxID=299642 RepID=A0A8X6PN88_NEPPI|nr:hypothetical protein NPIL_188691 [Nephila pilipes]
MEENPSDAGSRLSVIMILISCEKTDIGKVHELLNFTNRFWILSVYQKVRIRQLCGGTPLFYSVRWSFQDLKVFGNSSFPPLSVRLRNNGN